MNQKQFINAFPKFPGPDDGPDEPPPAPPPPS